MFSAKMNGMKPVLPSFLLTTDAARKPDPLPQAAALRPGQGIVLRHYHSPNRAQLARQLTRLPHLTVLIAADWRLAAAVKAHGIHLPEGQLRHGILSPLLGWAKRRHALITAACHNRLALAAARRIGAHGVLVSPVFTTASHPDALPLGLLRFARICRSTPLPVLGLGGMRRDIRKAAGCFGMAGTVPITGLPPHPRLG